MAGCIGVNGRSGTSSSSPPVADLNITPASINFGSVAEGATAHQSVSITNTGTASARITNVSILGSGFSVQGIAVPLTLEPGQDASFTAEFTPGSTGSLAGTISLTTTATDTPMLISVFGKGIVTSLSVTPASTDFGGVVLGNEVKKQIEIQATGTASVQITKVATSGSGFSLSGLSVPLTLSPGSTATFAATFAPSAAGSDSGEISITSNAADSPLTIGLSGQGEKRVVSLSVTPPKLTFGATAVGKSSSKDVVLKSTGNSNVDISAVSISGSGFSVSGAGKGTTLGPGQSITLAVKFDPSKQGSATGTVKVMSNITDSPTEIGLAGLAGEAIESNDVSPVTVGLQWNPSTTANVIGYYVYRGTQAGTYSKISAVVSATSYVDSSVQAISNTIYYYVVTAVNSNGVESGFSNEAVVTIPSP